MELRSRRRMLIWNLRLGQQRKRVLHERARKHLAQWKRTTDDRRATRAFEHDVLLRSVPLHLGQDHNSRKDGRITGTRRGAHQASLRTRTVARILDARQLLPCDSMAGMR